MSKVTITLEDKGGGVEFSLTFEDGFSPLSSAHQIANLMLKHADTLMTPVDAPTVSDRILVVDSANG